MARGELNKLIRGVRNCVELEVLAGAQDVLKAKSAKREAELVKREAHTRYEMLFTRHAYDAAGELQKVWGVVEHCHKCPLYKTKTHYVFGDGNPNAELLFAGEAPGHDEDIKGLPFVGRAGMLLTNIIEAMGRKRKDVYIANVLKCRPPENRQPLPDEVEKCRGYLEKQVEIIKPKIICALGRHAAQTLLNTTEPITQLRGKFHEYRGVKLMPTYHPAYLLRNPNEKKTVWQDMKKVIEELKG